MHTKAEAVALLGIEPRKFTKCQLIAGITSAENLHDARKQMFSEAQVERIRQTYEELYGAKTAALPAAIEQRLAALEAEIARLRERAPYLFSAAERPVTPFAYAVPAQPPVSRQNRATGAMSRYPPLPSGWVSVSTWAKQHEVNGKSVPREIGRGILPVPEYGEWRPGSGGRPILSAYTLEQHAAADRAASAFWPDRFQPCALFLATTDAADATTPSPVSEEDDDGVVMLR